MPLEFPVLALGIVASAILIKALFDQCAHALVNGSVPSVLNYHWPLTRKNISGNVREKVCFAASSLTNVRLGQQGSARCWLLDVVSASPCTLVKV